MWEPMPIHEQPCTTLVGTNGLQHVFPMHFVLRDIKGAISRACSVLWRVSPLAHAHVMI